MIVVKTVLSKLPNTCWECVYRNRFHDSQCYCSVAGKEVWMRNEDAKIRRDEDCPLTEINDIEGTGTL